MISSPRNGKNGQQDGTVTGYGSSERRECTIDIDDLAYKGLGVGRRSGKVYFVPFTVPGDRVRISIQKDLGTYGFGIPIQFQRFSDDRNEPPCPQFGHCGGCQLQHIQYPDQARWKQKWISDHIERIGRIPDARVDTIVTDSSKFEYRNKASVHIMDTRMGFLERVSPVVVDVPRCLLLDEIVHEAYEAVRQWNKKRLNRAKKHRILIRSATENQGIVIVHDPVVSNAELKELQEMLPRFLIDRGGSRETIRHQIMNVQFVVDAEAFFQVNGTVMHTMTELIAERTGSGTVLVDAHAGVGWPSLCMSSRFSRIEGIDISKRSVALANRNAGSAGIHHARYYRGTLHSFLSKRRITTSPDCLLCDPPRRGIDPRDMRGIQRLLPRRIVYISCDPATLARDLGRLVQNGYELKSVTPIDLFPQTFHVESIALLILGT